MLQATVIIWILHCCYAHVYIRIGVGRVLKVLMSHIGRSWCVANIIWSCAPLVRVACVVSLVAHHYCRSNFCFVHVVHNPFLLPYSNTLAHLRVWIWYVHNMFFGVLSKSTLHEVTLNCSVPSVPNSFLVVVPWHVPTVGEILKFKIDRRWHVSRGCVVVAVSGMNIYIFGCQVQQLVVSFHTMGLGAFSLCTQHRTST
jgi:hypothetical protein